uniref:RNase H type-1 domain-containing protein n=1 Tax=Lactuca sativa TaxID=4236 RepID=A0A9R1XSL8_LACSA|nr:hypothetical protein LSAT_V11C200064870 [Lactuca sativa]
MPRFHTLKGCIEKSKFQWTTVAKAALQQIKEALHKLPTLAGPIPGETLQVYLSTSAEAISSVLVVEREGEQRPAVFSSTSDRSLDKLADQTNIAQAGDLGSTRKMVNQVGQAQHQLSPMNKHQGAGTCELFARNAPGGEGEGMTQEEVPTAEKTLKDNRKWTLYTDGASNREVSGAGLILTCPEGEEVTYALRFDFHTSNNEAEYEA